MCGIAGILALSPDDRVQAAPLRAMAAALRHRGPDDEGVYVDPQGRCGLAFRRLSVIDLPGGRQPMKLSPAGLWVVFNGEIYNYRELRTGLAADGSVFCTNSDTEVILHAWAKWGDAFLGRLIGMFALALWDERCGRLLLARDRFGKKPLVYAQFGGRLYFASEAKAILALPEIPREVDPQALHEYLLFQYVPAPGAAWRGFRQLPPGCRLEVRAGARSVGSPTRWWEIPRPEPFRGSYEEAKQELGSRILTAVRRRLVADVPLGAFLSGGVDSTIVVGVMRRLGVEPLRTFTVGFDERRYDERRYARLAARHFRTEHHEQRVTPRAAEILDRLAWHYDQPLADSSAVATWYVSEHARRFVTVALTGDAGDEGFLGYDRYRAAELADRLEAVPAVVKRGLAAAARLLPQGRARSFGRRVHRFLSAAGHPAARRYLSWVCVWPPEMLRPAYRPEFSRRIDFDGPVGQFESRFGSEAGCAAERANRADLATYLPCDLLVKVDVASMAWGLECRSPLLDHELIAFALSLPARWRMNKRILKDWAAEFLPAAIRWRGKMGFGVPVGEWLRGELREMLLDAVFARDGLSRRVLDEHFLRGVVDAHLSGRSNHEHRLWALLMLEVWWRVWGRGAHV